MTIISSPVKTSKDLATSLICDFLKTEGNGKKLEQLQDNSITTGNVLGWRASCLGYTILYIESESKGLVYWCFYTQPLTRCFIIA